MRDNPIKQRLSDGGSALGTMVFEFFTPGMAQIAAAAGAEFVLYDMEHSGAGIDTIKAQMAACRGLDVVPMVRVPTTQYHFIARCLDAGAMGIMVPMVESVAQAKDIVSFTRYPPHGVRGAGFGMAHDDYTQGAPVDKIAAANRRTLVIAQIETPRGADAVDEIAAIDGIDVLWLGHFDMTNFMGIPGQFTHPKFLDAVEKIVAAAQRHGKTAGFMPADESWARDYVAKGFRIHAYGVDSLLLQQSLSHGLAVLREASAARPPASARA